jgi:hypothetical protein
MALPSGPFVLLSASALIAIPCSLGDATRWRVKMENKGNVPLLDATSFRLRGFGMGAERSRPGNQPRPHWFELRRRNPAMDEKRHPEQDPAGSRKTVERQLDQPEKSTNHGEGGKKSGIERDAEGQFAKAQNGRDNNGISSAAPRVVTGDEGGDATWPVKQDQG